MSREKQTIEEMKKDVKSAFDHKPLFAIDAWVLELASMILAKRLYSAGYHKSDWISVEERLPPESKNPILVTDGEKVIVAYINWLYRSGSTGKLRCPANYGNGMHVTHWMPLPPPPKENKND